MDTVTKEINEVWRYMPANIGEEVLKLLSKIWREGGIPDQWRKGVIYPIYKKGDKAEVGNDRGVTLMNTVYKLYASILNDRLMNELESKLEEDQFGFR